ncbi:hypothetical protein KIH86_24745 [Paenibacillus sp. HN-1]|uniref:hypothetical protein n=1 Tax=Paenibacillus TaxID=44249 RepID=UPI001CA9FE7E|nr:MULTISPECIES: hypothetical protein [Paenibacillus]MBY9077151.1 hypothetical protein [Paenibacillus sp. CGMCC 1.18879]MBY9087398.1 hypothetical protein [Paenibacillus sinensis]
MPSFDEQIVLNELRSLPDQRLTDERSEMILEKIRGQQPRVEKAHRRGTHLGWTVTVLITCLVFAALIGVKPLGSLLEPKGKMSAVDPEYVTAARKAVQSLGVERKFRFDVMERESDYWIVRTENREAIVTFTPNTTKVLSVSATVKAGDLPKVYQPFEETARAVLQETKQPLRFQTVNLFRNTEGTSLYFQANDNQFVGVDSANRVNGYSLNFKLEDMDRELVSAAEQALSPLAGGQTLSFATVQKYSDKREGMWKLTDKEQKYSVTLGAVTHQIYEAQYFSDQYQYRIKSADEAVTVSKPLIQAIFGTDITGYKVYGGRSWGGYVLVSTGKPSFSVLLGDLETGGIIGIHVLAQ